MLLDERGGSKVTALIYVLVAIVVIYAAVKTVPAYMDYYSMEDEIRHQVHLSSINSDAVILSDIKKRAAEMDIPLKEEDITLTREPDGAFSIHLKWSVDVDYGYGFRRLYNFDINTTSREAEKT
jgi:FlaG/FlaF family flagellin (archaellin)